MSSKAPIRGVEFFTLPGRVKVCEAAAAVFHIHPFSSLPPSWRCAALGDLLHIHHHLPAARLLDSHALAWWQVGWCLTLHRCGRCSGGDGSRCALYRCGRRGGAVQGWSRPLSPQDGRQSRRPPRTDRRKVGVLGQGGQRGGRTCLCQQPGQEVVRRSSGR